MANFRPTSALQSLQRRKNALFAKWITHITARQGWRFMLLFFWIEFLYFSIFVFLYFSTSQLGERDWAGADPQHQEAQVHLQREGGGWADFPSISPWKRNPLCFSPWCTFILLNTKCTLAGKSQQGPPALPMPPSSPRLNETMKVSPIYCHRRWQWCWRWWWWWWCWRRCLQEFKCIFVPF